MKAIDKFNELDQGVLGIVRAADVYAIHVMSAIKGEAPPLDSIRTILGGNKMSGWNIGGSYSEEELLALEKKGHFKEIGQQIIVATHTALESYLILKFQEYYKHLFSGCNANAIDISLNKFNLRCLKDFKENYVKLFGIHLPSFEFEFIVDARCNFKPQNCWEAIRIIDESRHDIVHKGALVNYKVISPMDSWYPFEFVRKWVLLFDSCFNHFIYENRETPLYLEHKNRAIKAGIKF